MGFWDAASGGMNTGVELGGRAALVGQQTSREERDLDRAEREQRYADEQVRKEDEDSRKAINFGRETTAYNEKEAYKKLSKKVKAAQLLYDAGDENGAVAMVQKLHNEDWPDGMQGQFYRRQDVPDASPMAEKWDSDPLLKGSSIAYVAKAPDGSIGGVTPFKSAADVVKFAKDAMTDPETFFSTRKQAEASVAGLNAKEEPFIAGDGHRYVQTWKLGLGGIPEKGPVRAYEDVAKETEGEKKLRDAKTILGKSPNKEQREVLAGVSEKEKASERTAGGVAGLLKQAELNLKLKEFKGKERDQFMKDLDLVLRLFADGKTTVDLETDEINQAGMAALRKASDLVTKAGTAGSTLTPAEQRDLPHAQRARQMYESISGVIAQDYPGAEAPGYGKRPDGTPKGTGFFGEIKRPDGKISTELSVGVEFGGKKYVIPTLVPTLTKDEIDHLIGGGKPTKEIIKKAVEHAKPRIAAGKSAFAQPDEQGMFKPGEGQAMNAMPPPADHADRIIKDTETGKRFKSDGKKWSEVK